jgi:hypothetical protein
MQFKANLKDARILAKKAKPSMCNQSSSVHYLCADWKSFLLMAGCLIPYKPQKALPQSLLQQQQPDKTVLQ